MWDEALVPADQNCARHCFTVHFDGLDPVGPKISGCLDCWDARLYGIELKMDKLRVEFNRFHNSVKHYKV